MSHDAGNVRYAVGDVVKVVYLPDKVHVIDLKSLLEEKQTQVSILFSLGGALILIAQRALQCMIDACCVMW